MYRPLLLASIFIFAGCKSKIEPFLGEWEVSKAECEWDDGEITDEGGEYDMNFEITDTDGKYKAAMNFEGDAVSSACILEGENLVCGDKQDEVYAVFKEIEDGLTTEFPNSDPCIFTLKAK